MKFRHILLLIGVAIAVAAAPSVKAAVVFFPGVNIPIPQTFDGIDLDIETGNTQPGTGAGVGAGFDVNFFFGGAGIQNAASFQPVRVGTANNDPISNVPFLSTVDAGSVVGTSSGTSGGPIGIPPTHMGPGPGQFASGDIGYIGFQFTPSGSTDVLNGWMRVILTNNAPGGLILDYAYQSDPLLGIVVPEPSVGVLGALAAMVCFARRRRKS